MALMKAVKRGEGFKGRDLNSGWARVATKKFRFGAAINSTSFPSGEVPEISRPPWLIFSAKARLTS